MAVMATVFVLSHNLQVVATDVPSLTPDELAQGLQQHPQINKAEPLQHPHWMVRLEAELSPAELAHVVPAAWRSLRQEAGHAHNHAVLALGGRKDSAGAPGSPLQEGCWGVDVVETTDAQAFLAAINWEGLKQSRPADGVFEVITTA